MLNPLGLSGEPIQVSRMFLTGQQQQTAYKKSSACFTKKQALLAVCTGLEPVTSCVTGRHSNQLN